jgi:hypothetical protein
MFISYNQTAVKNHNMKTANRSFENVAQFRYLGMTVTNQNLIEEEIKRRLNFGIACYHSVQNLLPSPLSKNVKLNCTEIYFACGVVWVRNLVSDIKGESLPPILSLKYGGGVCVPQ